MDPPNEAAYHIVISSVHGSVLNSSSYRPGIAPDYVQKYMTKQTIPETESDVNFLNTEAENVNNSIEQDTFFVKIIGRDGSVLEKSLQSWDRASTFQQEYPSKQCEFGSSRKSDQWKHEQKATFRKHVHGRPESEFKTEYIKVKNFTVGQDNWFVNHTPAENSKTENQKQITNNPSRKRMVIIWVICLIGFPRMAKAKECQESLSTVTLTPSCPTTEKQWTEKALLKKCPSHSQSCSSSSDFVYHCLINAFGNATVEVCAPKIRTSYCVEFNGRGARIQANFHSKCTNTTIDCGKFYNSNEMYKVPQCYSSFNEHSKPFKLSETMIPHNPQTTTSEIKTTDSYTTIHQTEDSRYVDKSSNGADRQLGNTAFGIIIITTFILIFVLLNALMILKRKELKKPFHQTDIETAENITQELIS